MPDSVAEAKIPVFKLNKNDISPEPQKQVSLANTSNLKIVSANLVNLNPNAVVNKLSSGTPDY